MGKQPYIPLYIGDWEQDLNCVSLEAEGAALKLIFKLWKSPQRGLLSICFSQMAILLKKSEPETRKIFDELTRNNIFSVKNIDTNTVEISSRRMLREASLSKTRSETGSKGGRPKKERKKQIESKTKPNQKLIHDNELDIGIESVSDSEVKGGAGGIRLEVIRNGEQPIIYPSFDDFWNAYDKKVGRENSQILWANLLQDEKEKIMDYLPDYVSSKPDKQFRKDPETFLNNKSWNDEIIKPNQQPNKNQPITTDWEQVKREGKEFLRKQGLA